MESQAELALALSFQHMAQVVLPSLPSSSPAREQPPWQRRPKSFPLVAGAGERQIQNSPILIWLVPHRPDVADSRACLNFQSGPACT